MKGKSKIKVLEIAKYRNGRVVEFSNKIEIMFGPCYVEAFLIKDNLYSNFEFHGDFEKCERKDAAGLFGCFLDLRRPSSAKY